MKVLVAGCLIPKAGSTTLQRFSEAAIFLKIQENIKIFLTLMSSVAHRLGHVEFWIFVFVFFGQAHLKKSKQIFDILNFYLFKIFFGPIIRNMFWSVKEKIVFFLYHEEFAKVGKVRVHVCSKNIFWRVCDVRACAFFWACDVQLDFLHFLHQNGQKLLFFVISKVNFILYF